MLILYVLVLGGAILWGTEITLKKHFLDSKNHKINPWTMIVGSMLTASIVAFIWQFSYYGPPQFSDDFWIPFTATACLSTVIESAGVFALIKEKSASLIGAIQGLTPIFVLFTSWIILKEFPTPIGLIGVLSVVVGLYLFRWQKEEVNAPKFMEKLPAGRFKNALLLYGGPLIRLFSSRGAQLAFLTAITGSIALNTTKMTVMASSPGTQVGATWMTVALVVFIFAKSTGRWKWVSKEFYIACAIGVMLGIMEVMFSSGYLFGIVPYVGSLKRFQIIVTAILGAIFLKESYGRTKIAAAAIIFVGIVLIAF